MAAERGEVVVMVQLWLLNGERGCLSYHGDGGAGSGYFWVVGIMFLVCLKVTWLFQREGKEGSRKVGSYE